MGWSGYFKETIRAPSGFRTVEISWGKLNGSNAWLIKENAGPLLPKIVFDSTRLPVPDTRMPLPRLPVMELYSSRVIVALGIDPVAGVARDDVARAGQGANDVVVAIRASDEDAVTTVGRDGIAVHQVAPPPI